MLSAGGRVDEVLCSRVKALSAMTTELNFLFWGASDRRPKVVGLKRAPHAVTAKRRGCSESTGEMKQDSSETVPSSTRRQLGGQRPVVLHNVQQPASQKTTYAINPSKGNPNVTDNSACLRVGQRITLRGDCVSLSSRPVNC